MIDFKEKILSNGMRIIAHQDITAPLTAMTLTYCCGSRDERPEMTGLAHLFEHLMFTGSKNVKDYDQVMQMAGGDSNAFTNQDVTCYYCTIPTENIESALWMERDRMESLNLTSKKLEVQRKVVIEEFKETCLNEPYGDAWHHLTEMSYKDYPYRWPVIGKDIEQLEKVTINDAKDFFRRWYQPSNAILSLAGPLSIDDQLLLAEKWFSDLKGSSIERIPYPIEKDLVAPRRKIVKAPVPLDGLYMVWHFPERNHPDYFTSDIISDILATGHSSRLIGKLVKKEQVLSAVDAYLNTNIGPGMMVIEARPATGVSLEDAEKAIMKEIKKLRDELVSEEELRKVKNNVLSSLLFSEIGILNKAQALGYYSALGDTNLINNEVPAYESVTAQDVQRVAKEWLQETKLIALEYHATKSINV
jgi:zinc protease